MNFTKEVIEIFNTIEKRGFEVYVVGGAVRDFLLNKKVEDYDFTTNAKPEDIIDMFDKVIPLGIDFGTVIAVIEGRKYEITTYRKDFHYTDKRRPDQVIFSAEIDDDLSRRDFTINAVCVNKKGEYYDVYNGIEDIQNKVIRCIGNPEERFSEDALRMLRAVRFMTTLGFTICCETEEALKKNACNISHISEERIREEFNKILLSERPSHGILKLIETGLIMNIMPELNTPGAEEIIEHTSVILDKTSPVLELRLAALFHESVKFCGECNAGEIDILSAQKAREILERLKYSKKTIKDVYIIISNYHITDFNMDSKTIKKYIYNIGTERLEYVFEMLEIHEKLYRNYEKLDHIRKMKIKFEKIIENKEPMEIKDLDINGYDLIELGVEKGTSIGMLLEKLLDYVLEYPEKNKKSVLMERASYIIEKKYPRE